MDEETLMKHLFSMLFYPHFSHPATIGVTTDLLKIHLFTDFKAYWSDLKSEEYDVCCQPGKVDRCEDRFFSLERKNLRSKICKSTSSVFQGAKQEREFATLWFSFWISGSFASLSAGIGVELAIRLGLNT